MKFSIDQQIEEIERELKYRRDVYPRLVATGKMRQSLADFHIARMEAALETMKWAKESRQDIVDWIRAGKLKALPSNATLTIIEAGTEPPQPAKLYADAECTIELEQPIVLGDDGRLPKIFVRAS